ncbi:protein kinase domain-containing protein [Actinokineospora sp. G85]|uniref:serine/threonine-protein kinase n=1 Tax=Actinokineospora sp. G85 TaxID=3406626 RepID=UPI003C76FC95
MTPPTADHFGPYRLDGLLGEGGMGKVYRAFDTRHNRFVALKVMRQEFAAHPGLRARFEREARLLKQVDHPNVVRINSVGEIEGRLYLDMELVQGRDLADILRAGPLPVPRAVALIGQVAAALTAVHEVKLVHRDVKPGNIAVTEVGGGDHVRLLDFGIARSITATSALTKTGMLIGTPLYLAPELIQNQDVTSRADVYALGCVLYECLVGRPPFTGQDMAVLQAHCFADPPVLSRHLPSAPPALDAVILGALAKEPDVRTHSAEAFAAAAAQALRPRSPFTRVGPPSIVLPTPVQVPATVEIPPTPPLDREPATREAPVAAGAPKATRFGLPEELLTPPPVEQPPPDHPTPPPFAAPRIDRDVVTARARENRFRATFAGVGVVALIAVAGVTVAASGTGARPPRPLTPEARTAQGPANPEGLDVSGTVDFAPCDQKAVPSTLDGRPASVTVANERPDGLPVLVHWVDTGGTPRFWFQVAPNTSTTVATTTGSRWVLSYRECSAVFSGPGTLTVG